VATGGREEAAREALQSTFLRVARYIKRFDSEAAFWSWLTVLAKSALVDEQRKQQRYLGLLNRFFQRELTLRTVSTVAVNISRSNTYRLDQMIGVRKKRGHADNADIIDARLLSSPGRKQFLLVGIQVGDRIESGDGLTRSSNAVNSANLCLLFKRKTRPGEVLPSFHCSAPGAPD
jgi:DNA-directed RNA polymerase specialized sigma24 family protein